jgi:hypothetical protein
VVAEKKKVPTREDQDFQVFLQPKEKNRSRASITNSNFNDSLLLSTADLSWVIRERMARPAGPMSFNAAFPEEAPTGRIDPLLIAHTTEHRFGEGQFGQTRSAPYKLLKMIS